MIVQHFPGYSKYTPESDEEREVLERLYPFIVKPYTSIGLSHPHRQHAWGAAKDFVISTQAHPDGPITLKMLMAEDSMHRGQLRV